MGGLPALVARAILASMSAPEPHRRTVKHYHDPGDVHELTFSCYRRMPLLTNDAWRRLLSEAVDRSLAGRDFRLVAFVFMPEHVHLLVYPHVPLPDPSVIEALLAAIKRPYSFRIKQILLKNGSPLLAKLTVPDKRRGKTFRYWQKGPGYDRNFSSEKAILSSIDYVHNNPVRRGLCQAATDWRWSSARWYASDRQLVDEGLPRIDGLPAEFF
jgi:putative transposase